MWNNTITIYTCTLRFVCIRLILYICKFGGSLSGHFRKKQVTLLLRKLMAMLLFSRKWTLSLPRLRDGNFSLAMSSSRRIRTTPVLSSVQTSVSSNFSCRRSGQFQLQAKPDIEAPRYCTRFLMLCYCYVMLFSNGLRIQFKISYFSILPLHLNI